MQTSETTLITAQQLAKSLNLSERTIRNWQKARKIPFCAFGRAIRFNPHEVMAHLAQTVTVKALS